MTENITDKFLISLRYSFAALNASLLTHILHPFDVVKIRFQSNFKKSVMDNLIFYIISFIIF